MPTSDRFLIGLNRIFSSRRGPSKNGREALMPLTMLPTGLQSPVDKDCADYTIFSGEWAMGRIYEQRGGPKALRWFWTVQGVFGRPADMYTNGHAPTLDEAKRHFETTWRRWLAWAKMREDAEDGLSWRVSQALTRPNPPRMAGPCAR
jgi:hypothetical protein